MQKYKVQNSVLKNYIKFFWEINADYLELNHKIIPVRNIDLKFNLSETPHYLQFNNNRYLLEEVYFSGLQDHFRNARILLKGKAQVLGICFQPEGFYPFIKIPVSEFKNQLLGVEEIGFYPARTIIERLKEAQNTTERLSILEKELISILDSKIQTPASFQQLFNSFEQNESSMSIGEFCFQNNIGERKLERLFNKFIGISAKGYSMLNRFQNSVKQLMYNEYSKLSDIAFDNEYFDQMHYIRDFKRFAGVTPKQFVDQNNSMLHVGKSG